MARDPFAPVQQSSVPQFVWIIVGVVGLLVVLVGTTMAIVISKRPPPGVATPTAPAVQPTPSAGTPPAATDTTKVATNDGQPAEATASDSKPDKSDKGEKKHHRSSGGSSSSKSAKTDSKPAGPSSPPPPPKKQNNMSQKEIDKLLGI